MQVLVAARNVRLLKAIALTFSAQFSIQTASTLERCAALLRHSDFDLVIVGEKLADGPGLPLLGQIARSSPDTLRVFAARRSRLQLLKGKLGPFGLFRTIAYPIDPRRLMSTLTLARTGIELAEDPVRSSAVSHLRPPAPLVPRAKPVSRKNRASHPQTVARLLAGLQPPRLIPPRPPQPIEQPAPTAGAPPAVSRPEPKLAIAPPPPRRAWAADPPPKRAPLMVGAALIAALLLVGLSLRRFDDTGPSPQIQVAALKPSDAIAPIPAQIDEPHPFTPSRESTPAPPHAEAPPSQPAEAAEPIADPSTFGSEAAEPIYSN